ncbi:DEAD/DEAH box helicase [Sphingobium ummariense]|uniref:DEAD/DEAH box helicase n=1 Tax=Sphingobium ummariense RL-3 TaxID=1346791 RepID=T0K8T0_9SPHN|nr:DEAD/DEAH box helicase [Sphingobium ummariense]EQB33089.1 DEAD/DEAH box helicase [Sphingobium ummariense RL-3]
MQFTDLGLAEPILKALAAKKYTLPTPIQSQAIPVLLQGRDLCGIAQTGTGKTAAFALPSLDFFARNPKATPLNGCRMLVLSPTRELAAQIAQSFRDYGRFMKLSVEVVFGGVPINRQIKALSRGVDIVVATPGRLLDLIDQRAFTIKDTEIFVLDEADQMMDMGFIHPLRRIAKLLPAKRQNLFFSATMPKEIEALAGQFLNDPVKVSVAPQSTTAERVRQQATFVNQGEKQALLHLVLASEDIDRALIFTRTKHGADRVVRFLEGAGIEAFAIHGNKSQGQRTTALQAFRQGKVKLLVATDIAARGIDVSGVSHVINFELPNVPEQYVHRIGRTARAGAEGVAISFVADDERPYLKAIERATRVKLDIVPLPENFSEAVRNLPKAAPQRKGKPQTPAQQTKRADGQRRYQDQQKQQRGTADRAHRTDGEQPAKKPFHRRRGSVGAHKGAVQRTGAPR